MFGMLNFNVYCKIYVEKILKEEAQGKKNKRPILTDDGRCFKTNTTNVYVYMCSDRYFAAALYTVFNSCAPQKSANVAQKHTV